MKKKRGRDIRILFASAFFWGEKKKEEEEEKHTNKPNGIVAWRDSQIIMIIIIEKHLLSCVGVTLQLCPRL